MFGDVPPSIPVQSIAQGVSDCKHFPKENHRWAVMSCSVVYTIDEMTTGHRDREVGGTYLIGRRPS